ncbi:MAG: organic hydroperoxide resistance protein [Mycobacteriaceae bacterium]|nr:organic hydroperoxide resistance protein [Mycobacteriaceae bacterium]
MTLLYTAEALATGDGRSGHTRTSDGKIDVDLSMPKAFGGDEVGANPEQLLAAGYAACFHGTLRLICGKVGADIEGSAVGARVSLTPDGDGLKLAVELEVVLPHVPLGQARELAEATHRQCPFSKATRGNIDVEIIIGEP